MQRARTAHPGRSWTDDIADGLEATGDEELLRRAIDNVLANAAAHTPQSAVATLTARERDGHVVIEVSDDGPGVSPDQLPRIFYRAGAPSYRSGSDLGLAIVAAIAAAHDGRAEAALNEPHGLRVTLTMPTSRPPASSPDQPQATGLDRARRTRRTGQSARRRFGYLMPFQFRTHRT